MTVMTLAEVARESARLIRLRLILLSRWLLQVHGDKVHRGPFQGMTMIHREGDMISAFVPRLLGFYEQDLHEEVEAAIARGYGAVATIGCAEGYYSVGLARRMPTSRHFAFDTSVNAQRLCQEAAMINGVADRLAISGECDHATLDQIITAHSSALLVVDCEGSEGMLLDPATCPALRKADIIVECHEFLDPGLTDRLVERFRISHAIQRIEQGARNPAVLPFLHNSSDIDRWVMVMEDRPKLMWWLIMKARRES